MNKTILRRQIRTKTRLHTGLDSRVEFDCPKDAWAQAEILHGIAVYRFSADICTMSPDFLRRLVIHELAHITDLWLHDGPRLDRSGRRLVHDALWKKLCRILGDPQPTTRM